MSRQDTGLTLKSLVGILMAVLLTHCVLPISTDLKIDDSHTSLSKYLKDSVKVTNLRPNSASGTIREDFALADTEAFQTLSKAGIPASINAFSETEFSCKNETLGLGNENEFVTGPCETNWNGNIIYQCTSGKWTVFSRKCVLQIISDLKRKVEVLIVEQIPEFMAQLCIATMNNSQQITDSPLTVQTTVEILVIIASVSQNIIISESVMEDFLKTVDILVSNEATASWQSLTKENPSISLLSAVEDISNRLTEGSFTINQKYIELNRTVINNSYTGKSNLPNSATEILIPQILNPTSLTIIIFTTLNNILPTQDSANGIVKPDMRINGDLVVVKANQTLHSMSFVFDTTDQSLGNPQCVFWNFNLSAWDSTGCEVKPGRNETGIITCECNHTASFSILMSPFSIDHIAFAYVTYIGVGISVACLILCLIIEAIVWKAVRRNDTSYMRHVSIVNIAISLLIADVCFIIGAAILDEEQLTPADRCSSVVFFMHFFYLALFFWMLISALLLFYRVVMVLSQMSRAKMMVISFLLGYGAPLLISVITVASTVGPQMYVSKQACWLNWNESRNLLAFVIPALTIVAINLVVFIVVLYKIFKRRAGAATQPDWKNALVVARCVAFFTPALACGITWGFGIGTTVSAGLFVHVVFALFNSLQGFFILVFGTLLDSKVRKELARWFSLRNLNSSSCTRMIQR
nr:adhesion G-protein coupled receptor F1 [Danio rerio]|eukprot:XP_017208207.1 adhesion G-protein coupled receptor F1 [Danio rerio]